MQRSWRNAAVSLCLMGASAASAQAPAQVLIIAEGCPNAEYVRAMLAPLVAELRVSSSLAPDARNQSARRVHVRDLGEAYEIDAGGARRVQRDPARDCSERARVAAVFIALNLHAPASATVPAAAVETGAIEPSTPESEAGPRPAPEPNRAVQENDVAGARSPALLRFRLGAQALAIAALGLPEGRVTGGAGLGLWFERGPYRLELAAGGLGKTELPLSPRAPGGRAELVRIPTSALVSYLWRLSRFSLGPSLGVAFDLLRVRATGVERSVRALRANTGILVGAQLQFSLHPRIALVGALGASIFPRVYALSVEPEQRRARTPQVWLAAQVGLACMFW